MRSPREIDSQNEVGERCSGRYLRKYLVEMRFDGSGGVQVLAVFSSTATEHSYPKAPVVTNWSLI